MPITLYTDGSCEEPNKRGGYGIVIIFNDGLKMYHCGKEMITTNNKMELKAVIESLKLFKNVKEFKIYSDSKYVINCAQKLWKRNKNLELWEEYDKISNSKKIEFEWVKGHNGDENNELADFYSRNYTWNT